MLLIITTYLGAKINVLKLSYLELEGLFSNIFKSYK